MAAGIRPEQRPGDQVGQHGAHDGVAGQDDRTPRRRRGPSGRLEDQHSGQVAADEQRQQQQPHHRTDPVAWRQRLGILHRDRLVQLVRDSKERGLQLDLPEEALRRDHDQRVTGLASDVRAVELAPVDRVHRQRTGSDRKRVQPHLQCHRGNDLRRTDHTKGHIPRHQQLQGTDQAQREQSLADRTATSATTTFLLTLRPPAPAPADAVSLPSRSAIASTPVLGLHPPPSPSTTPGKQVHVQHQQIPPHVHHLLKKLMARRSPYPAAADSKAA